MNKFILFIASCIICCVYFSSCKKCTQNEVANLKFTSDETMINPYGGNERLVFKNLSGDSIVFSKGKRSISFFTHYQNRDAEYNNGCKGDYYTDETDECHFYTQSGDSSPYLEIMLGFNFSFDNPVSEKSIFLQFYGPSKISGFSGYYLFGNNSLFNYHKKFDTIVAMHPQITIGPRTYTNVYELYAVNREGMNQEWFSFAYYSIKVGFCGFKTNYGTLWYLDKKSK